ISPKIRGHESVGRCSRGIANCRSKRSLRLAENDGDGIVQIGCCKIDPAISIEVSKDGPYGTLSCAHSGVVIKIFLALGRCAREQEACGKNEERNKIWLRPPRRTKHHELAPPYREANVIILITPPELIFGRRGLMTSMFGQR